MISITSAPEAPPPRIRILDSRLREVETVRIGDKLTFRIEIPEDSKFKLINLTENQLGLIWKHLSFMARRTLFRTKQKKADIRVQ